MYFDSLTYTAIGILVLAFVLMVRFCICGYCGGPNRRDTFED